MGLVEILLLIVLLALFAYFMLLLGMMRILTVYIKEKYESPWETDWKAYRDHPNSRTYLGYTRAGTFVFQILGVLSLFFCSALLWLGNGASGHSLSVFCFLVILVIVYEAVIYFVTIWRHKFYPETSISHDWKRVFHSIYKKEGGV